MTFSQSATVQCRCCRAHSNRRRMCNLVRVGTWALTRATRPCRLRARRIVSAEAAGRPYLVVFREISAAMSYMPDVTMRFRTRSSLSEKRRNRTCQLACARFFACCTQKRLTRDWCFLTLRAILLADMPCSCNSKIFSRTEGGYRILCLSR